MLKKNKKNLVFMIKNQGSVKHFPGYYVFPWKKTNKKDGNSQPMAALYKLVNEVLAFDLEAGVQSGQVKQIKSIGTAPPLGFISPHFSTSFYGIELTEKPGFSVDGSTAAQADWKTPEEYLQLFQKGQILALPSSINLLKTLHTGLAHDTPKAVEFSYGSENQVPWFQPLAGIYQLLPIAFTFPPDYQHRTNCFIIGDPGESLVMVDPSPKDDREYKKLVNTLKKLGLTYTDILLTHHHVDHHQRAPNLARDFSIPITMSKDSHQRILKQKGETYFEGIEIKFAKEGDVLTRWLGKKVKVYEIPGHDEGQLALAPESMEWFIVGDLIQSTSTVVIGGEEGDMAKYFQSLERVIQLDPMVLLPSHGIAIGTTHQLKDTLKHRKIREQQILHLYKKGKTPGQMVKIIYKGVDRRLWPLALENIKSHLKKLEQEQAI
ncbi:MAG: MBL fold metallo-hydrolase [Candidatus Aminicenantes bacterium]|nr:MAG: MBL fold metallo-hydrolase [Candidatus Aminicenantes bacterium]